MTMGLAVKETLQLAIAAYESEDFREAERLCRLILQKAPRHALANHHLGMIALTLSGPSEAIPFFKTALMEQPDVESFWAGLINALILDGQIEAAQLTLTACEKAGVTGELCSGLKTQLEAKRGPKTPLPVTSDMVSRRLQDNSATDAAQPLKKRVADVVDVHYQNIVDLTLAAAAPGWLFVDSFDRHFISPGILSQAPTADLVTKQEVNTGSLRLTTLFKGDPSRALQTLSSDKTILEKRNLLRGLIEARDGILVEDSFFGSAGTSLGDAAARTFQDGTLNVLIIGGGPCGLLLASGLKASLCDRVNVLVVDNRSSRKHLREPFSRRWLTQISTAVFSTADRGDMLPFFESLGKDGCIGVPINELEGFLQIVSKHRGVKFFFSSEPDYASVDTEMIDLVFDATGGHLCDDTYSSELATDFEASIPPSDIGLEYAGVRQLFNTVSPQAGHLKVMLKPDGGLHRPYIGATRIHASLMKLTGITTDVVDRVLEAVSRSNPHNSFYVWRGRMKDEINEGLILVNLLESEAEFLRSLIGSPLPLESTIVKNLGISGRIRKDILRVLDMLLQFDARGTIKIEPIFEYSPYINLNANSGRFLGKRIFPIGDSLFCGHPKMGNGLANHLDFVNRILQRISRLEI